MLKSIAYNLFYYKNAALCKLFPDYIASNACTIFFTPRVIPQQNYEKEFEISTKHNILKIPTSDCEKIASKFSENNKDKKDMTLNKIPKMPKEITVLEFPPDDNSPKRESTILCIHGWEGKGTNFYKFIQKLIKNGFRVLAPDYPMHGNTGGEETGCHAFGFAVNCILNYINCPVILLVHSLGNGATCMNYYLSDEKTRNQLRGFVGLGVPNTFEEYMTKVSSAMGLDEYSNKIFLNKNSEMLGIDVKYFVLGEAIKNFDFPCLIVHDEKDKEVLIEWALKTKEYVKEKYQTYKIGDKEYSCFYKTTGLGHRRILRDDKVVEVVVDFISNIKNA